ncbi:hypothetical protein ACFWIX_07450 [Pseudarthrobacter sp. NPDC058362]|uniref:hypothetical protein n=1 Tax=unclassified Pseudarthrobacter TaxID=2647000 RepID=UPI00364ED657
MTAVWIIAALVVAGFGGWPVTTLVFKLARTIDDRAADPAPEETVAGPVHAPDAPRQRILRGGAIIGVLERLGVAVAILTGQSVAIAYIVAIKGLGRFAELKETPVAAERFIIGTLTSLLWAAGTTALVMALFLA